MLQNNVCLVPPYRTDARSLHTLHLVRETVRSSVISCKESVYKLYFVERGEGKLTVRSREYELREGDLFFTFPAMPYTLSFEGEHSFVYVSFLGTRANQLMDRLGVGEKNLYFRDCQALHPHLNAALEMGSGVSDLMAESVLLYVFAFLANRLLRFSGASEVADSAATRIKEYVDEHFADPSLSLSSIGQALAFHPKYVSSAFKKEMRVSMCEYLCALRIRHACTLMDKGYRSVSEIASRCGFSDGQYFSKVFKKSLEITPIEYIRSRNGK